MVSGTVTANIAGTVPVSGTFWPTTQPVTGTVTIGNASMPVTGTFWPTTQPVSGTFWQATQPVSITGTVATSAASLPLPSGAATETTVAAISTKTPALGQALMAASSPVTIASNQSAISTQPATPTPYNLSSATGTNLTSVRAAPATLFMVAYSNVGAAAAYVKLYNKASAPVVATDVPVITLPMGAATASSLNLGALGHRFTTGIALAITMGSADTDATAIAANQVKVVLDYV